MMTFKFAPFSLLQLHPLQGKDSSQETHESSSAGDSEGSSSRVWLIRSLWLLGTTLGLSDGSLNVVGLGAAEVEALDDLVTLVVIEGIAREVARRLGVERALDILEGVELSPEKVVSICLNTKSSICPMIGQKNRWMERHTW